MTFTATHARGFIGTDITVTVVAGVKESIGTVTVMLDGHELDQTQLSPGTDSYTHSFSRAGSGAPGMEHMLEVSAIDQDGNPHNAVTQWTD
jgi:hypothetical protein